MTRRPQPARRRAAAGRTPDVQPPCAGPAWSGGRGCCTWTSRRPDSTRTEAERALLTGGAAGPLVERSLLWALGIFVVFAPLAVAMYRRRI